MKINSTSTSQILSSIKIGDHIEDNRGNSGKVTGIEIFSKNFGHQYYFRLGKSKTILIIK
jgi:cell envelope opacity-associated protein A